MNIATRPLTPKQQAFCREYLIDTNLAASARRAGYSARTAKEQGYRLFTYVHIKIEIQRLLDSRADKVELDATYVLARLREMTEDPDSPAMNRVKALALIGRHLGMFRDKVDVNEDREVRWIQLEGSEERKARYVAERIESHPYEVLAQAQARIDELDELEASHPLRSNSSHDEGSKS